MTAFYLVVLFPLLNGLGFSVAHLVLAKEKGLQLARHGGLLYLLFLSVPLTAVVLHGVREGSLAAMGLAWPHIGSPVNISGLTLAVAVASLLGAALYYNEIFLSVAMRDLLKVTRRRGLEVMVEGKSRALVQRELPFGSYMLLSTAISFTEELLWRGFLIYILLERFGMGLAYSLAVSAALFGVNHGVFGVRSVLLKTFDGLVWGAVRVATGSIFVPFVSHLVFQYFVWRRIHRLSPRAA